MTKGNATSGLDLLVGMLSCKSIPILIGLPYSKLSPTSYAQKQRKLDPEGYIATGGGGGIAERELVNAFGNLPCYHRGIKTQW